MEETELRKHYVRILAIILIISLLTPATAAAVGDVVYTNTRKLADNLEYVNTIEWSSVYGRNESFSISMRGAGDAYPIIMSGDSIYGASRISTMVGYAESLGLNVLAVANADFFALQTGIPLGILIENGVYMSSPGDRAVVSFGHDNGVHFAPAASVKMLLHNLGYGAYPEGWGVTDGAGDNELGEGEGTGADTGTYSDASQPGSGAGTGADTGTGSDAGLPSGGSSLPGGGTGEPTNPGGGTGTGGGADHPNNTGKEVKLINFNKMRTDTGGLHLFSAAFSSLSTRTTSRGWFVRFKILEGTPSVAGTMLLEVTDTINSEDVPSVQIGEGYLVLSSAKQGGYGAEYEKFAVGDVVTLTTTCEDENLRNAKYATGAGDMIVAQGAKTDSANWDRALLARAPRTAFGLRRDGSIVSYVVDGRNSTHSVGLTMDELADEMIKQGCEYAINLDGGGSTALSVRIPGNNGATTISKPSDGSERGCSTYILYVTDAVSDGEIRSLALKNDGIIVLAESSVELQYTATDTGYRGAAVPDDIQVFPKDPAACVEGALYTAGSLAGTDIVTLYSPSANVSGRGEVFVITRPTSITPSIRGLTAPLIEVKLFPGQRLELDVVATYYRRAVVSQPHSYGYTITGDVGEMIEPGVFVAGQNMQQTGTITVSAGGRSAVINVEIGGFLDMMDHWARGYAEYLAYAGIVTGVTPTEYDPERMISRGDFSLMLYRCAGKPEFKSTGVFVDVPDDIYYATAVAWAYGMGIADAVDGSHFEPASPMSRQDTFTWIYRMFSLLGIKYEDGTREDLAAFPDAGLVADYAQIPTATLIKLGIVNGMGGKLEPLGTLTRAQMAKVVAMVVQLSISDADDGGVPGEEVPVETVPGEEVPGGE